MHIPVFFASEGDSATMTTMTNILSRALRRSWINYHWLKPWNLCMKEKGKNNKLDLRPSGILPYSVFSEGSSSSSIVSGNSNITAGKSLALYSLQKYVLNIFFNIKRNSLPLNTRLVCSKKRTPKVYVEQRE
ncbi:uncharacterized protein OCT59_003275 [Rhizophagus irregularis]|uniref:uncharacterized protein n=1 Tax=Rhizophagus irregularis TaxID=588596 RepID=UPI00332C320D|nr:hypothetical protein OCT59_003275 [Rhizophagus irregularis]